LAWRLLHVERLLHFEEAVMLLPLLGDPVLQEMELRSGAEITESGTADFMLFEDELPQEGLSVPEAGVIYSAGKWELQ
jgi:hypothetical protein